MGFTNELVLVLVLLESCSLRRLAAFPGSDLPGDHQRRQPVPQLLPIFICRHAT
jgi:hypothetical protein